MNYRHNVIFKFLIIILPFAFMACRNTKKPPEKDIVVKPEQLVERTKENIETVLGYAEDNQYKVNDSVILNCFPLVNLVYKNNHYETIWSASDNWHPLADSLLRFIEHSKEYGLFPSDYYYNVLTSIRNKIQNDSNSRKDAALWTRADIVLTDAYFNICKHLKWGRLQRDTLSQRIDTVAADQLILQQFSQALSSNTITQIFEQLEPKYKGYVSIRAALPAFIDSAHFANYTLINYPFKDSVTGIRNLQTRLTEAGYLNVPVNVPDSVELAESIIRYQTDMGLKPSGKISGSLVKSLNDHDWEKFKRIAVTLDRYRLLPDTAVSTYAVVNIPAYTLYVYEKDSITLQSRVIVGAPKTRTPLLNSEISNFITYPQWTVPYSIIFKEMLPKIKKDVTYLARQNLMVVDHADSVLNPDSINWSLLSKNKFPYLLRQRQGDDNSLGVIKFNFRNKYDVYLHDTNARWLFARTDRALSHGCVRVQEWEKLSHFLVRSDTMRFRKDTLRAWIARQEKHVVSGFPRLPLYIRYFTVEGKEGKLKFYDDVYGEDRMLKEKYFAGKAIS